MEYKQLLNCPQNPRKSGKRKKVMVIKGKEVIIYKNRIHLMN